MTADITGGYLAKSLSSSKQRWATKSKNRQKQKQTHKKRLDELKPHQASYSAIKKNTQLDEFFGDKKDGVFRRDKE